MAKPPGKGPPSKGPPAKKKPPRRGPPLDRLPQAALDRINERLPEHVRSKWEEMKANPPRRKPDGDPDKVALWKVFKILENNPDPMDPTNGAVMLTPEEAERYEAILDEMQKAQPEYTPPPDPPLPD